ncbi:MAG: PleD family two-component system response regulator [Candidatus Sumerlaeia bacterium]
MSEKKPVIMVADDEEDIKSVLEMFLEAAGYDVVSAYDGLDAIEKIRESKPDLVLMDIMMPLIDGIEVVRQMKADDAIKDIPVIMLTAAAKSDMVDKAIQAGAVDYIQKPFEPEQVQGVIEKTLMSK